MQCRPACAACCIYPSISSAIPMMPEGKPEMVRCAQLTKDLRCAIFGKPTRPLVCGSFSPERLICGDSPEDAKRVFEWLSGR